MAQFRNTWIDIRLDHITSNLNLIRNASEKAIFAVIKANAYGHGDVEVARHLEKLNVSYLCVSSLDEAVHLRKHGIETPVIILGYCETEHLHIAGENKITCIIPSKEWLLNALSSYTSLQNLVFHIKIDSGMNRVGIKNIEEYKEVLQLAKNHQLNLEGVCTHLSSSNMSDQILTDKQLETFKKFLESSDSGFRWIHVANSDAAVTVSKQDGVSNAVRCGISMYGYSTFNQELQPVLSLHCGINQIKKLYPGDKVSYSATYTASKEETIAIIPIGYADGLDRKLQGFHFSIKGHPCEVIGRVCMDLIIIRVPVDTKLTDVVEIIGYHRNAADMAKHLDTIPYEILTSLSPRITRRYWQNNDLIKSINERFD